MTHKFRTQVETNIDHDSVTPPGFIYESRYTQSTINYNVDLEVREWGIKSILFMMLDQSVEIEVEVLHEDKEDSETVTLKLQLQNMETELPDNITQGDICPTCLDLTIESLELVSEGVYQGKATGTLSFN